MTTDARWPDFFVLGAAKSGTTSICAYLNEHDDLLLSQPKEPIFFEAEWERGLEYYWRRYYTGWTGQKTIGEGRVFNLFLPFVASRIGQVAPQARLIVLLRDPVERAHSHWWHRASQGLETLPFEDAMAENQKRIESGIRFGEDADAAGRWPQELVSGSGRTRRGFYLELGFYAEQIARYRALFPADQIRVVLSEELAGNEQTVTRNLWSYLGLDDSRTVADTHRRKVARSPRRNGVEITRPALRPETAAYLAQYYAPHNRRLSEMLGRNLDSWLRPQ